MTIADYIAIKKEQNTTMCAAVLYPDGEVEECVTSHLKTLMDRLGEDAWDQIPKDESPLFWLTGLTGAVLIDYENQVYSEALSDEQENGLKDTDLDSVVNLLRSIHGVGIAAVLKPRGEELYKVSMRSKGQYTVNEICAALGGGGHACAAGCTVSAKTSQAAEQLVLAQIAKAL